MSLQHVVLVNLHWIIIPVVVLHLHKWVLLFFIFFSLTYTRTHTDVFLSYFHSVITWKKKEKRRKTKKKKTQLPGMWRCRVMKGNFLPFRARVSRVGIFSCSIINTHQTFEYIIIFVVHVFINTLERFVCISLVLRIAFICKEIPRTEDTIMITSYNNFIYRQTQMWFLN